MDDLQKSQSITKGACTGFQGGLEGLSQYMWTIFNSVSIQEILAGENLTYTMAEMGDNCIIMLRFTALSRENSLGSDFKTFVQAKVDRVVNLLHQGFARFGMKLKREETWASDSVIDYGKEVRVKRVLLPFSLKKASGASALSTEDFPDLEGMVSNVLTACSGAGAYPATVLPAFLTCMFLSHRAVDLGLHSPLYVRNPEKVKMPFVSTTQEACVREGGRLKPELINVLEGLSQTAQTIEWVWHSSFFPVELGGLPIPSLREMMQKGKPDPVSLGIKIMHEGCLELGKRGHTFRPGRLQSAMNYPFSNSIDLPMLIENPLSVNLVHASSKKIVIRRFTREVLTDRTVTKNELVRNS